MNLQSRTTESAVVLELSGRFDNYVAPSVAAWLEQAAAKTSHVVVNLAGVSFVDSSGLATLVQGLKRCRQRNGDLYLCGLQRQVYMVFELARLDRTFSIFVNEELALKAIQ